MVYEDSIIIVPNIFLFQVSCVMYCNIGFGDYDLPLFNELFFPSLGDPDGKHDPALP